MIDLLDEGQTFSLLCEKVSSGKGAWKLQLTQTFDTLPPDLPAWALPHREGIVAALHGERGLKATIDFADRELRWIRLHVTGEQRALKPDEYEQRAIALQDELVWSLATVASVQLVASVKTGELVVRWTLLLPTVPGAWGRLAVEAQLLARCLGRQPDLEIRHAVEDRDEGDLFGNMPESVRDGVESVTITSGNKTVRLTPSRKQGPKAARSRVTRSRLDA